MNGSALFDTNVITKMLKDDSEATFLFKRTRFCYTSTVVAGELYYAAINSGKPDKNLQLFRNVLSSMKVIPITNAVAYIFAEIKLSLKKKGKPIPENDIWIAATAKAYLLPLATFDNHFSEIPEIELIGIQKI